MDGNRLDGYRLAARSDAQATPTWRYWPGTAGAITYNKTALWLHTLERMLGWDTLQRILSTYFSRWAFKHPKPEDFFAVANEVSGRDLTWFFDQVYRSSNVFDYGVDTFTSERADARGYVGEGDSAAVRRSATSGPYRTTVVVPGATARAFSRGRSGGVRERRGRPLALGRPRSVEAVRNRQAGARARRRRSTRTACCCST